MFLKKKKKKICENKLEYCPSFQFLLNQSEIINAFGRAKNPDNLNMNWPIKNPLRHLILYLSVFCELNMLKKLTLI